MSKTGIACSAIIATALMFGGQAYAGGGHHSGKHGHGGGHGHHGSHGKGHKSHGKGHGKGHHKHKHGAPVAVPEPSTLMLLGAGGIVVIGLSRRQKASATS